MFGSVVLGVPVRRVIRGVSKVCKCCRFMLGLWITASRCLQVWLLLAICTLSALPWMVVEFKKANYSVHYQGEGAWPRRNRHTLRVCYRC